MTPGSRVTPKQDLPTDVLPGLDGVQVQLVQCRSLSLTKDWFTDDLRYYIIDRYQSCLKYFKPIPQQHIATLSNPECFAIKRFTIQLTSIILNRNKSVDLIYT